MLLILARNLSGSQKVPHVSQEVGRAFNSGPAVRRGKRVSQSSVLLNHVPLQSEWEQITIPRVAEASMRKPLGIPVV